MAWTRTTIRTLLRKLTGEQDTTEVSNDDMDLSINQYYQNVFPVRSKLTEFEKEYSVSLVDGTASYAVDAAVLRIDEPLQIDDLDGDAIQEVSLWRDKTAFRRIYPEDSSAVEAVPGHVLLWRGYLYPRPIPDTSYTLKMPTLQKPTALSATNETPLKDEWGPIIAYGAAIQRLTDAKDLAGAQELLSMFEYHSEGVIIPRLSQNVGLGPVRHF